jgi:hypothetical protein
MAAQAPWSVIGASAVYRANGRASGDPYIAVVAGREAAQPIAPCAPKPRPGSSAGIGGLPPDATCCERGFLCLSRRDYGRMFSMLKIVKTRPKVGSAVDALLGGVRNDDSQPRRRL